MQDQGLVYGAALQKPSQDQGLKLLTNTGSESQQVCGSAERNEGIAARLKQINGELKKIGAHMDESGILVRKEALELEREDLKATINPKGLLQEMYVQSFFFFSDAPARRTCLRFRSELMMFPGWLQVSKAGATRAALRDYSGGDVKGWEIVIHRYKLRWRGESDRRRFWQHKERRGCAAPQTQR